MATSNSRRDFFKKAMTAGAVMAPLSATFGNGLERAAERTSMQSRPADLKITEVQCGTLQTISKGC